MPFDPLSAGIIAAGSIAGAIFGKQKAPAAVQPKEIDIGKAAGDSINANLQNFGSASRLSRMQNDFAQTEATRLLDRAIPGFSGLQSRLMASINEDLNSQDSLPTEVSDNLARLAAEKGISRGTSGNFNQFSLVRDFGFSLVDWKNAQRARALNTLSTVYGMAPRVNPMTPMATFVDPNTAIQAQGANNANAQATQQGAANAQAAASNYNRSLWASALQTTLMAGASAFQTASTGVPATDRSAAAGREIDRVMALPGR
jgi:hypothetical protein